MKTLQMPEVNYVNNYWFDYNPALTHFMSSLSVLFPDGERFFMKTMNAYRHDLDEDLKKELNEFCFQEANHGRVHTMLNEKLNTRLKLRELEKDTQKVLERYTKFLTKKQKLAVTVCLEHLTAIMGKQLIERTDLIQKMSSDIKNVWVYHAQEEVEHAHVSFEIYKAVGGTYLLRSGLMIPLAIILAGFVIRNWIKIMEYDQDFGYKGIFKAVNVLIGHNGFIRNMNKDFLKWFNPNFKPSDI